MNDPPKRKDGIHGSKIFREHGTNSQSNSKQNAALGRKLSGKIASMFTWTSTYQSVISEKKNYSCLCPDPEKQPKVTEHHEEPDEKKKVTGYCPTLGCRYKGESKVEDACPAWAMPKKEQKAEPDLSKMNGFDKLR